MSSTPDGPPTLGDVTMADGPPLVGCFRIGPSLADIPVRHGSVVGRSRHASVRLYHGSVSRSHAIVLLDYRGEPVLCDLQSQQGTQVAGRAGPYLTLVDGCEVSFGQVKVTFHRTTTHESDA